MLLLMLPTISLAQPVLIEEHSGSTEFEISVFQDNDVKYIHVHGDMGHMFGYSLVTLMQNHPDIEYISVHSIGGDMSELELPAKHIFENKIPFRVETRTVCLSACAFLALYSPTIVIDGQLGFHLPYLNVYNSRLSLSEVSQSLIGLNVLMARDFFDTGWKLILLAVISANTNRDSYLVFDDGVQLDNYRFSDPADFTGPVPQGARGWAIRTGIEMAVISRFQ